MSFNRLRRTFALFRVPDWIHVLGIPVLGFSFSFSRIPGTNPYLILPCVALGALYLMHGYAFNETFDALARAGGSASVFAGRKELSFRLALMLSLLPLAAAFAAASTISPRLAALVLAGGALSFLYSAPPFRLKGLPVADLLVNSLGFSILFLLGASVGGAPGDAILPAVLVFILFLTLQLIHEIVHTREDRGEKTATTAVRYGTRAALALAAVSLALLTAWSLFLWSRGMSFWIAVLSLGFAAAVSLRLFPLFSDPAAAVDDPRLRMQTRLAAAFYCTGLLCVFLLS